MLPNSALTNVDIENFGKKYLNHFRGVFMRDTLPSRKPWKYETGVINLDSANGIGTHWVAYAKNKDKIQYFDSFGNLHPPKEVIKYLGHNLNYNYTRHQNYNTHNCGHLCLSFLLKNMLKKNK